MGETDRPKKVEQPRSRNAKIITNYVTIGTALLVAVGVGAVFLAPHMGRIEYNFLSILMALAGAAFMVAIPGTLEANWPGVGKATGALAVFLVIMAAMFYVSKYEDPSRVSMVSISGYITLDDMVDETGDSVFQNLECSVDPPTITRVQNTSQFKIENAVIFRSDGGTDNNPRLRISKAGYTGKTIEIRESEGPSAAYPYIVRKNGSDYSIDISTPVTLVHKKREY